METTGSESGSLVCLLQNFQLSADWGTKSSKSGINYKRNSTGSCGGAALGSVYTWTALSADVNALRTLWRHIETTCEGDLGHIWPHSFSSVYMNALCTGTAYDWHPPREWKYVLIRDIKCKTRRSHNKNGFPKRSSTKQELFQNSSSRIRLQPWKM